MKFQPKRTTFAISIIALTAITLACVADDRESNGLIEELTGKEANAWTGLKNSKWTVGGWAAAGINYNTDVPNDNTNGPVNMTDRNGEINLYQMNLFLEKALGKGSSWEVGGRLDYMYGTDTRYTQAAGDWDSKFLNPNSYYNIAIPQAYVEAYAPYGNGISAKIGHFYTIIGYESVPSALNFFSSHTYSFKSSPFTTTGALFNYNINERWNINLGAVKGMDNFDLNMQAWSQMSGLTYNNAEIGATVSFSIMQGPAYPNRPNNDVEYYTAVFQQQLGSWHYVLQHDRGTLNHAENKQTAAWYSVVQYLTYQMNEKWSFGGRGEWFRDQNGFRYGYGEASFYDVSLGANWKPKSWLLLRPELRYDWSQAQTAPFDSGRQPNQTLFLLDAVVQF